MTTSTVPTLAIAVEPFADGLFAEFVDLIDCVRNGMAGDATGPRAIEGRPSMTRCEWRRQGAKN